MTGLITAELSMKSDENMNQIQRPMRLMNFTAIEADMCRSTQLIRDCRTGDARSCSRAHLLIYVCFRVSSEIKWIRHF